MLRSSQHMRQVSPATSASTPPNPWPHPRQTAVPLADITDLVCFFTTLFTVHSQARCALRTSRAQRAVSARATRNSAAVRLGRPPQSLVECPVYFPPPAAQRTPTRFCFAILAAFQYIDRQSRLAGRRLGVYASGTSTHTSGKPHNAY